MKLDTRTHSLRSRDGSTVLVVMAIIALLLIYSMANLRTLDHLRAELKLLEERQVNRVEVQAAQDPRTKPTDDNRAKTVVETTGEEDSRPSQARE